MGRGNMHLRSLAVAVALVASLAIGGVVLAAGGTLNIGAPWGPANQDPTDPHRVVVTYTLKATGRVPIEAVAAVEAGVQAWIDAIDGRESSWDFDIVPFSDSNLPSGISRGNPILACHSRGNDSKGCGTPPPSNGDDKPDIVIQLKKGGGLIAGSAQSTFDNGFRVHVKIQISGGAFGLANDAATITEVTMHEFGHALALGHHSNQLDLMGTTVGYEGGGPSACDLDGFEESHHWLTELDTTPHTNHDSSVTC